MYLLTKSIFYYYMMQNIGPNTIELSNVLSLYNFTFLVLISSKF